MHLILTKDYAALSAKTARLLADKIIANPTATVCLTSGDTPNGVYKALVGLIQSEKIDISQCFFVGLDEWVGMNRHDAGSCGSSVYREFVEPLAIENFHFFDGKAADLAQECQLMDEKIASLGGLDIMLVGLGTNGHIGLNEPGYAWKLKSHVSNLHEATIRTGQKYFTSETALSQGITLGLSYFSEAKASFLIANGASKAEPIRKAIMDEATEDFPASILQVTSQAIVIIDEAAAVGLR
jgi:galactosamine-6-phosphate isomerase